MKSSYYDSMLGMFTGDYANFWLKPAENPTAQLKADKEELLEGLEYVKPALRYFPEKLAEIESLIQKMKQ